MVCNAEVRHVPTRLARPGYGWVRLACHVMQRFVTLCKANPCTGKLHEYQLVKHLLNRRVNGIESTHDDRHGILLLLILGLLQERVETPLSRKHILPGLS